MLNKILDFFQNEIKQPSQELTDQQRRLASAALLIEVATIDHKFDQKELSSLSLLLKENFSLSDEECTELTELAKAERDNSTSLYQFTQLVNQHCSHQEKFNLLKDMWTVAYADGNLDKYEEYIIRKVADLIHMAHGDFIRAKHESRDHT
ncbi:TerB family tellurite resistance protein [Teredinibacter sp. KSP-S5-2]|uniref:tellurite resistance TerB family protein n=1 Tax=Teredinibacter sp. KSP-S5-2 TaxID=3034506 RepID=UPI0029344797|nr:TerB family tellurite resistance protein [Teredinibacter sp. KSP-S5-2]WNO11544.1 TerB family tellurite resistance protein [Teredinibacter sp. KSP-S5-2]